MTCKCVRCTYHERIRMRKIDGIWWAECPRCGTEYEESEEATEGDIQEAQRKGKPVITL